MSATPFQTGGGGTNFEQNVQATFLLSFLIKLPLPTLPEGLITELLFQSGSRGYQTDDLFIEANDLFGSRRMLMQIKNKLVFTEKNEIFLDVIKAFWNDFNNNELFDKKKDKLVIVTGGLSMNVKSHLIILLNYSRTSASYKDFFARAKANQTKNVYLSLFAEILKTLNGDLDIEDEVLWYFLRCLIVLEFDFTNDNSKDLAYCLQLIKLSKQTNCSKTETSIWNGLVNCAANYNTNGGNINGNNIKDVTDLNCFDPTQTNVFFSYLSKLISDSNLVLEPVRDNIQGLRFEMHEEKELLINSISEKQLTIITGIPGAGKSALAKSIIREGIGSGYVIFKADQLQSSTLAGALSAQGIHCTIEDLFCSLSLFSNPILFIESAEKLLEGDYGNAFSQLISFIEKNSNIRIVMTARSYAVDLIVQRYYLPQTKLNTITVKPLSDTELQLAEKHFPILAPLMHNLQIKELLRSPKYLTLSLLTVQRESVDLRGITISGFKAKLWSAIIGDATLRNSGMSNKREKAFYSIALERARSLALFVQPDQTLDDAAIEALENDEVLYRNGDEFSFAPSHDIFEDWALVRYVSDVYKKNPDPVIFFRELGHEPAVRRALRLWIEDTLQENASDIIILLRNSINEKNIERYWADELLIAVFRSNEAASFFVIFESELLSDSCKLLERCIHLLRTCCRETSSNISRVPIQLPIGSGWQYCLLFINNHSASVELIKPSVLYFLSDWEYRFLFSGRLVFPWEIEAAKELTLFYIDQVERGEHFWKDRSHESFMNQLIDGLFRLAGYAKKETEELIKRSIKKCNEDGFYVRRSGELYNTVINKVVSGINTDIISFLFPDLIMYVSNKVLRYRKPRLPKNADKMSQVMFNSREYSINSDQRWAIKDKNRLFPPGVHKIPVYNLLRAFPEKTLDFIIEFINCSIAHYAAGEFDYKHELEKVTILVREKGVRKIWGAKELWVIFRGISVTSYLLESILKSLEKYLLEICERNRQGDQEKLQKYFKFIYDKTNSVAPIGVLASVTMAYPEMVGDSMIPLLSIPEAYSWDFYRVINESSALAIYDQEIPWWAQQEKYTSNDLPHRKKYKKGLSEFIINFQINNGSINTSLSMLFDRMGKLKSTKSSLIFQKLLTEIDVRKWKPREYSDELGGFPITPEYNEQVKVMMEEGKELIECQNQAAQISQIVKDLYEKPNKSRFENWESAYVYYCKNEKQDIAFDRIALLCIVGLRDFNEQLSEDEKKLCISLLMELLNNFVLEVYHLQFEESEEIYNPIWEISELLKSIGILIEVLKEWERIKDLAVIVVYLLKVPFDEYRLKEFIPYFRSSIMQMDNSFGKTVWRCMVELAAWQKQNVILPRPQHHLAYQKFLVQEKEFIYAFFDKSPKVNQAIEILFETHDAATSVLAMELIPFGSTELEFLQFIPLLINEIIADFSKETETGLDDWPRRKKNERRIPQKLLLQLERWISGYLLFTSKENATVILEMMVNSVFDSDKLGDIYGEPGLLEFVKSIFDGILEQLDLVLESSSDYELNRKIIANFWIVWDDLFTKVQKKYEKTGQIYFQGTLLFDIKSKWSNERKSFPALTGYKYKYERIANAFSGNCINSLLNVLTTIGVEELLPDGLIWLKSAVGNAPKQTGLIKINKAEQLSEILYKHHIQTIKIQQKRLNNFLWLLDYMISDGSSKAYLIRENVITYKSILT